MSEKSDRKELRKPDEFQVRAGRAMEWIAANQPLVLGAVGAVVLVALLAWGAAAYRSSRESTAGSQLAEALELGSRPIAGDPQAARLAAADTFASKDEREKATVAALGKVRAEHGSTTAGQTALAELGFHKLKASDNAGAQKDLEEFLKATDKNHPLRGFATESLAYALEGQGKLDEAHASFEKLREAGLPERADFHAARLALVQGKPDAKAQLQKVAETYPKDPVSMEANQRLELAALPPVQPGDLLAKAVPDETPAPAPGKKPALKPVAPKAGAPKAPAAKAPGAKAAVKPQAKKTK